MVWVVVLLAAVVAAQHAGDPSLADRASAISRLAYSATDHKNLSPDAAHRKGQADQIARTQWYMNQPQFSTKDRARAGRVHAYTKRLEYLGGTRDVVAYKHKHPKHGDQLVFGYRGTAILPDVGVDAKLALNMKRVKRLEEAREWTKQMREQHKQIPNSAIEFHGHSLGGWVAEGVGNDYPGSQTTTIEPGAPIVSWGSKTPRAYPKRQPGAKKPVRFVRMEDPVPMGVKNMGSGVNVKEKRVSVLNPLKNHFLANNIPWYKAPVPGEENKKNHSRLKRTVEAAGREVAKRATAAGSALKKWGKRQAERASAAASTVGSWLQRKAAEARNSYNNLKKRMTRSGQQQSGR